MMETFKIEYLNDFKVYNPILLAVITVLCIRSLELIYPADEKKLQVYILWPQEVRRVSLNTSLGKKSP